MVNFLCICGKLIFSVRSASLSFRKGYNLEPLERKVHFVPAHASLQSRINSLVFRRKDLCEAKHDLGVRKMCSKTMLCSHYATLWGGGGGVSIAY